MQYTEEEILAVKTFWESSVLFDGILNECGLDKHANPVRWKTTKTLLREETRNRIIQSIMANMDDQQLDHLRFLLNSSSRASKDLDYETVLLEMPILYPALRAKVFESLDEFFDNFVANYKEVFAK